MSLPLYNLFLDNKKNIVKYILVEYIFVEYILIKYILVK